MEAAPDKSNLKLMKIKHEFYKGMRITDKKTLKIVQMVLTGYINKILLQFVKNICYGHSWTDSKLMR